MENARLQQVSNADQLFMIRLNDKNACFTRLSVVVSLSAAIVIILPPGLRTPQERCSVSPPTVSNTTSIPEMFSSKRNYSVVNHLFGSQPGYELKVSRGRGRCYTRATKSG
jgi:hypothetical protein